MHGGHGAEDEPMAEMNLIPLIDIALTLLIIMMVTTAFVRKPGVTLKLPETVTREGSPELSKDQTVSIAQDGKLYMEGKPISDEAVADQFKKVAKTNKEARVLIKGDRDVVYARVMAVMDMARQAGLTKVVLPTDPKIGQTAPTPPPVPSTAPPTDAVPAATPGTETTPSGSTPGTTGN